jgi:epoxide hydrolase 4
MSTFPIVHERVAGAGISLHVARAGSGPPIILLHGFPENWTSWKHQIGALAEAGYTVLAPDLRGYGDSDRPSSRAAYAMPELVADVAALIRSTGSPKAILVGHDWGGAIAWAFAREHPEMLHRLVVLNAPHSSIFARKMLQSRQIFRSWYIFFFQLPWLPERLLRAGDFRAFRRMFREGPARRDAFDAERIERFIRPMREPGAVKAALDFYRANFRLPTSRGSRRPGSRSSRIDVETLVIWGERDPALIPELLDGLERYVPRLRVHRLPEVGHWVQNEAPEEVNRLLLGFLQETGTR